jgi:hypothetical protein
MYIYIKKQLWINSIFMVYTIDFIFKAQFNFMWFIKKIKMSEILHVTTFDTICTSNFDTKCLHHTMETLFETSKNIGTFWILEVGPLQGSK